MPNWCSNELIITGPARDLKRFKERAAGHSAWESTEKGKPNVLNFHSLVPIPDEIIQAGYDPAGYEWELQNWGVKWGACEAQVNQEPRALTYLFNTAWAPPLALLTTVAQQWPSLKFELEYSEPGMGFMGAASFAGPNMTDCCHET